MPIFKLVKNPIPLLYKQIVFMLKIEDDDIRYRVQHWPLSENNYKYSISWNPFPFPLEECEILSDDIEDYNIANTKMTEYILQYCIEN